MSKKVFILVLAIISNKLFAQVSGHLVLPETVIANYQNVWGTIVVDGCSKLSEAKEDEIYCEVSWDLLPEGATLSSDRFSIEIQKIAPGEFVISGAIDVFDPFKGREKIKSIPFRNIIKSLPLDVGFSFKGLPLDPFQKNEIFLENDEGRRFRCLFYAGDMVQTPIESVEDNKIYCNVSWQNIPSGFKLKNITNPTLFEGNLEYPASINPDDHIFRYDIKLEIPYDKTVDLGTFTVDASKTVVSKPSITSDIDYKNKVFYVEQTDPNIPLKATFSNPYREPMIVNLIHKDSATNLYSGRFYDGEHIDTQINVQDLLNSPGKPHSIELSLEYSSGSLEPSTQEISFIDKGQGNKVKLDSIAFADGKLQFGTSFDKKGAGTYRVYLAELTDKILMKVTPTLLDDVEIAPISDIHWTNSNPITISVENALIDHGRYVIVSELISYSKDRLMIIDRQLSDPIIHTIVSDQFQPSTITALSGPVGSLILVNTTYSSGQQPTLTVDDGRSISYNLGYFIAKEPGVYKAGEMGMDAHNRVLIYDTPDLKISFTPESPAPNQPVSITIMDQKLEQVEPASHTVYWTIDDQEFVATTSIAHSFLAPGPHKVSAFVVNDNSNDSPALSGISLKGYINVQVVEEEEVEARAE